MNANKETSLIIDSATKSFSAKEMAMLHDLPINALLACFKNVDKSFIRPAGWYLLSENDKILKLIEWLKTRFEKGFEIEFKYGISVDYTIKDWVIQGINYQNKI